MLCGVPTLKKYTFLYLLIVSLFEIDLHASKNINFSIIYQPKPYQKNLTFWLIRILLKIDSVIFFGKMSKPWWGGLLHFWTWYIKFEYGRKIFLTDTWNVRNSKTTVFYHPDKSCFQRKGLLLKVPSKEDLLHKVVSNSSNNS